MFHKRELFVADSFSSKARPQLTFVKMDFNDPTLYKWFDQAAEWAECKWGYMRIFPGIETRKDLLTQKLKDTKSHFYFAVYKSELIGTFSLTLEEMDLKAELAFAKKHKYYVQPLPPKQEMNLSYFYIHDNFRDFGFGSQMLDEAKEIADAEECTLTAHVLTPNLYGFYKKRDAHFDEEVRSLNEPSALIHF